MSLKIEVPDIFVHLASAVMQKYFSEYKGIANWLKKTKDLAHQEEKVCSPFGRIRRLPDINSKHKNKVSESERQATNMPIQSGASDIGQRAVIRLEDWCFDNPDIVQETGLIFVATVHDSFVFECNKDSAILMAKKLKEIFEDTSAIDFMKVPMKVDIEIGRSYGQLEEVDLNKNENIDEILNKNKKC